ncbi:MAG: hypothetical protein O7B35_07965, partial [Deltaproteobacteria bacterium]|nr:hypothetical protein [Deltaproteobacteria bacterium]
ISTPYAKAGTMFEAHRENYGHDDAPVLVWQAGSKMMNPTISQELIDKEIQRDPEAGRSEWLALFREDISAAFPLDLIENCVVPGRAELLPSADLSYFAFTDPSGGRRDAFTLSIAHRDDSKVIVDLIRSWKSPLQPSTVVGEIVDILKLYRVTEIEGDSYGGNWPSERFSEASNGAIEYKQCKTPKSQLYLDLIPQLSSGRVELPDEPGLIKEFRRLERRRGRAGRDTIDHPLTGSDDISNAVAGVIALALREGDTGDIKDIVVGGGYLSTPRWDGENRQPSSGDPNDAFEEAIASSPGAAGDEGGWFGSVTRNWEDW